MIPVPEKLKMFTDKMINDYERNKNMGTYHHMFLSLIDLMGKICEDNGYGYVKEIFQHYYPHCTFFEQKKGEDSGHNNVQEPPVSV